jgi:hypothetical protein
MCTGKGYLAVAIDRPHYGFLVILCRITLHDGHVQYGQERHCPVRSLGQEPLSKNTRARFQGRENSSSRENWTGIHTSLESAGKIV